MTAAQRERRSRSQVYSGHSTLIADLSIYASIYQPSLAILGLADDPPESPTLPSLRPPTIPSCAL